MIQSRHIATGMRRCASTIAALAILAIGAASDLGAQQDTAHKRMPPMPGMPGMPMPASPNAPASTRRKPATRAAKTAPKTARAATKPAAAEPSASAHRPARPVPANAAHTTTHAMPDTMGGMQMPPSPADTAAHAAHDMHDMPGMTHDARHDTTGHAAADTSVRNMPGMSMPHDTGTMRGMSMPGDTMSGHGMDMQMSTPDPLGVSMDRMGSGTTWVPDAAPIPSVYFHVPGGWDVTGHGFAFLQYDHQGGTRGANQTGSLNWLMLMASHSLAGGRMQARTMLSADALTVTPRGYPLLLQSGETYDGEPLHDRQHPHDVFMELSALYERPVTRSLGVMLYAAPSGEPALGPVAFMHRPSAMDNPAAPITHHWSDATHIAYGVLSAGLFTHTVKLEGSFFNGREPDQHRANFDPIRLDSWSARATVNPTAEWSMSAGWGYLKSPEALNPDESIHRVTASVLHGTPLGSEGQWASSVVWGANAYSGHAGLSHSLLAESEAVLDARNTVFGRAEVVDKSVEDLSLESPSFGFAPDASFTVGQASLGYIRDFARFGAGTLGLGAMGTLNVVPESLVPAYGSRTPLGLFVFLRARPFRNGMRMQGAPPAAH